MGLKVYELKKGDKIIHNEEIITFEEIRGEKAVFYNEWGIEYQFPDFFNIDEIGEIKDSSNTSYETANHPSLF